MEALIICIIIGLFIPPIRDLIFITFEVMISSLVYLVQSFLGIVIVLGIIGLIFSKGC